MKRVILTLALFLTIFGCNLPTDSSGSATLVHKIVSNNGIDYSLDIPSSVISAYDTLRISFKVKNNSRTFRLFYFHNLQQLAFEILDGQNNVVIFYPYIVSPATSNFTLKPGEIRELNIACQLRDFNGTYINKDTYILSVFLADRNSPKLMLQITII